MTTDVDQILPLHLMNSGESGEVVDIDGDEKLVADLAASGLRTGCSLELIANGNPCICRIEDTRLSFRLDGLVQILIRLVRG